MSGHHNDWAQMKSDLDDPDLKRPGGFQRQVRGRILGSVVLIVILVVAMAIVSATGA